MYIKEAKDKEIEGNVFVIFVINEQEEVENTRVVKGIPEGELLEKESIRVVNSLPTFMPGRQRDKAVKVQYTIPIKFKYKEPDGEELILLLKVMKDELVELFENSTNLQFSAAVACFGIKLRSSGRTEKISFKEIKEMAKKAKGIDEEGYRSEFVKMAQMAHLVSSSK